LSHEWFTFNAYRRHIEATQAVCSGCTPRLKVGKNVSQECLNAVSQSRYFFRQMQAMKGLKKHLVLPIYSISFYYSVYFSLRAYLLYKGESSEQIADHSALIRSANNKNRQEPHFFGYPYNILYNGKEKKFVNLPQGIENRTIKKITFEEYVKAEMSGRYANQDPLCKEKEKQYERQHSFTNFQVAEGNEWIELSDLDNFLTFLRTTSKAQIDHYKTTNAYQKKRIPVSEIVATSSFFSALYRLRIRLNYKDLSPFMMEEKFIDRDMELFCEQMCSNLWNVTSSFASGLKFITERR